jgi:hypothetical protein
MAFIYQTGFIKVHKETARFRSVANYRRALTYGIAKVMARWLKQNIELPHEYDLDSTLQCAESQRIWKFNTYSYTE